MRLDLLTGWLLWGQGAVYVLTGVWPLLSMRTFLAVTGPKTDLWLVKTVGALVAVVGAALLLAAYRHEYVPAIGLLAAGAAASLAAVDVVYVAQRRIGRVYLLDAPGEALLVVLWLVAAVSGGHV